MHGNLDKIPRDKIPRDKIPIEQIACKQDEKFPKLVIIKGAPGVGKTTLSWELCRQWANGKFWTDYSLVVLLRLRDESTQTATKLIDLLQCEDSGISRSIASIIRRKQGHGVLFIFEGLDELPEILRKDSIFLKLITGRLLPASTVFVTTRPWAVQELRTFPSCGQRLDQLIDILGFSSEQISEYIDLVIKNGAPAELRQYIDSNPRIASSMYNPLHARIIIEIYKEKYKETKSVFPNTTTEVYCAYSEVLLHRHLKDIPEIDWNGELTDLPSSIQLHFNELCYIAYKGITSEKQQLVFFKEDIQDAKNTLGLMNSVHPLHCSVLAKNTSPSYNFLHLTLQEFLAAFYISKNMRSQEQLILFVTKADDGVYKMILLFLAGLTGLKDSLVECIRPNPYVREIKFNSYGDSMCKFTDNELCWLYESQNANALIEYKGMQYDLQYLPRENSVLFALGYIIVSADLILTQLNFKSDNGSSSMLLAGMSKASSKFTLQVKNIEMCNDSSSLFSLITNGNIQPKIEQFSFTKHQNYTGSQSLSSTSKVCDLLTKSPDLRIVELDFGACRENIKQILDILKSKSCLQTLKCKLASADDEEILSTFIKHSSIKKLILVIDLIKIFSFLSWSFHDIQSHISVELSVDKLKADNARLLPPSLLKFPFIIEAEKDLFVKDSAIKEIASFINHWEASLKSLEYFFKSHEFKSYCSISEDFYRAILNCPLLEKLDACIPIELTEIKRPFSFESIFGLVELLDQLSTLQNLKSLSLYNLGCVSDVLNSLKDNHILRSLTLEYEPDSMLSFDATIGEFLQNNSQLIELHLVRLDWTGFSSNLMQELQYNKSLEILSIYTITNSEDYSVSKEDIILIAKMLECNATLQFLELTIYYQSSHELSPVLEALSTNVSLKHLELDIKSTNKDFILTLTAEETEALGNMLSKNSTLEVLYLNMEILDCQPIIKGLLENKTLKIFGTSLKTRKNIVKYPDYFHIRSKISYNIIIID